MLVAIQKDPTIDAVFSIGSLLWTGNGSRSRAARRPRLWYAFWHDRLAVEPGAHAVLFVDQARWHVTAKLGMPEDITLVPLPSKSPELNPVENIWQYMRDNWLSNRIFANYEGILDRCCFNQNKLARGLSCRSERGGGPHG